VLYLTGQLPLLPSEARELLVEQLRQAGFEPRAEGFRVFAAGAVLRIEAAAGGSTVKLELPPPDEDVAEWFVSKVVSPLLRALP
jgi:hypothetical protein